MHKIDKQMFHNVVFVFCVIFFTYACFCLCVVFGYVDVTILTLLPNKNPNVTVVVSCVWINNTRYNKSGLAGDCRKNLKKNKTLFWIKLDI